VITLSINGQQRHFPAPLSISELLIQLDLAGKRVAVERNGEIVPRSQHTEVSLSDADQLEIVVAVGGG
jgi:sulfur carrier protein